MTKNQALIRYFDFYKKIWYNIYTKVKESKKNMVYVGVEFRDNLRGHTREFWALVPYDETNSDNRIPFDPMLCNEFEEWVEDNVDLEWTEEQRERYYEECDWVWWYLDDEEIKEYEERSNKNDD